MADDLDKEAPDKEVKEACRHCGAPSLRVPDRVRGGWKYLGICSECRDEQLARNSCDGYVDSTNHRISKAFYVIGARAKPRVGGGESYARDEARGEKISRTKQARARAKAAARRKAEREGRMPKKGQDRIPKNQKLKKGSEYPKYLQRKLRDERRYPEGLDPNGNSNAKEDGGSDEQQR